MTLKTEIADWDMKSRDVIVGIYLRYYGGGEFANDLAKLVLNSDLQRGATWLLKHHIEEAGETPSQASVDLIFRNIDKLQHWESRLHILQIMEYLPITIPNLKAVEYFVRDCLASDKLFVRAWAFTGFCQIAKHYPSYKAEAKKLLSYALENEIAGSVKARVRRELQRVDSES